MIKPIDAKTLLGNGKEPKFTGELSQSQITQALNWYSQNRDNKDAQKYASEFLKKKHKISAYDALKSVPSTFGFLCRIVANGGVLNDSSSTFFNETIDKLKQSKTTTKPAAATNIISIQDHIKRKASECIGELEGQIDELITNDFKSEVSPYGLMVGMEIKGAHTKFIIDYFKTKRVEFDGVLETDDEQIKEGYSNFTKPKLKKLIAYCDQVIVDGMKLAGEAIKTRKPRKRKAKSAEQVVGKMNYAKDFAELKLVSVDPKTIIGASSLWVYNTKTRKLGVYQALDAAGLNVKGSTIQNFAESKSISKTLRKPAVTIPEVVKAGKVALRNVLSDIRAAETPLNGRINADTILLRTMK